MKPLSSYGSLVRTLRRALPLLALALTGRAFASEYHGHVLIGGIPIPGATITLTQSATTVTTITDTQGLYEFPNIPDGAYKIDIEMRGFTPIAATVTVTPATPQGEFELKLLTLGQMLAETKVITPAAKALQPRIETLAAPVPGTKADAKPSSPSAPAIPPPTEEAAERPSDGLLINGSESNAATSPFSLTPAFGNRRSNTRGLYTGSIGVIAENSAFDARPYSLTGLQVPKDYFNRLTTLITIGGPIRVPPLFYHGPNFFLAYQWTRNALATTDSALVPTSAERSGDLSGLVNAQGQPITIYNPATGLPYLGNLVPVNPQAAALLKLYPLPNLAGNTQYNYQTNLLSNTHEDALQSRIDKSIGRRDDLYGGFGFQSIRADSANLFNFRDTTDTLGIDGRINWQHRFPHDLYITLGYHLTRLRTEVRPQFENNTDVSGNVGITGNDTNSTYWGPPTLSFASGIAGLADGLPEFNRNRTDAATSKATLTYGRHTVTAGFDFRRQEYNEFQQTNPRGQFTFTGVATAPNGSTTNGSDLADFLIGIPDTSALAFGNPDKYFRQSVYDAYASDDWRLQPGLTINAGIRWEYGAPLTELFGRLVNLDVTPNYAAVAPVLGSAPRGSLTGSQYPASLIRPDRRGFEPRIGLSWRPLPASTLVVRAGYGIYDDTSIYLSAVQSMAQQAPLSKSLTVSNSIACPLTLANGFINCAGTTADNFAVDPNLRVGYAQAWQLSAQQDLPKALVATITYSGTKGTHGTQEFLPNTYPIGATSPTPTYPVGFVYRTSNGNSSREAGQVQLRRRLRAGFTATLQYAFSKSLDDDAVVGAQGHAVTAAASAPSDSSSSTAASPAIAQNWLNLRAERELSTFDQRHVLSSSLQYTSGQGIGGGTLLSGWRGRAIKEWTILAQINAGSGLPETPIYLAAVPGTGFTGTIRPDPTGTPIHLHSGGYFLNAAAYTAPPSGQWGTARRNSITGPGTFNLNASLARAFRLHGPFNLDVKLDATNLLNHAVYAGYNTIVNSTTFGLPSAVNSMRTVQITGRLRF